MGNKYIDIAQKVSDISNEMNMHVRFIVDIEDKIKIIKNSKEDITDVELFGLFGTNISVSTHTANVIKDFVIKDMRERINYLEEKIFKLSLELYSVSA